MEKNIEGDEFSRYLKDKNIQYIYTNNTELKR